MGKWFQDKSFSAKKWGQGGTNARKIHRDINARKLHRALGVLLAAALIFQTLPFDGIAVSASESSGGGLCTHHRSHTQDCGYKEAEAGHTCTHEHTEDCYRIVEGEDGSTTKELDCHHEHDESCGYRESAEGSPCTFVCEICNEGTDGTPEDNTDGNGINGGESENPGIENENEVKEPDTGQEECICEELCTEDNGNNGCHINTDCPVCGAEGASLSDCKGKDTEDSTEDTEENTDQPEDTDLCKHHREHDDTCGYLPESEDSGGSPCTYECRICPIEKLIAALPDAADITEDNEEVRAQLEEILALYRELNEDEQGQIDLSRCYELQEKLDAANIPDPVEEGTPDLELFGQKVCSGDSGDGWSYADGVLTLADYHSDNSGEVFVHITNADLEFTLYLKGDNSVKTSEKLIYGNAFGSTTITGDQGASLSLDGKSWADNYIFIRGVNVDVTTQGMIFLSYDMEIDNATVNFNMNGSNGYIYTTHGGLTIKNRSDVTITNLSGAVDYCVATNKAAITDSTLKITNPSGFGVYVTKISTQVSEYKASITNSTISAYVPDAGIHCEEEMAVTNSQVTGSGRFLLRSKKAITVDDSSTMKGIIYEFFNSDMGAAYQVYGSHTLAANLTVAENGSFVIPDGAALTIPDGIILENNGTMRIHEKDSLTGTGALTGNGKFLIDVNEDMISVPEGRVYTGKDYTDQIILEENATVCGVEFTADTKGWTRNIEPAVVKDAGEYKVTFTKGGKEISKTFTVAQSGTQFVGDGVVKTYKGSVVCSDFTADDTITVKTTPTATGAAPTKAAARLWGGPTAGQMAVFVGDMQVSEAVDVGADGSYAIAVKAADVLKQGNVVPNGDPITLTAKFVGNNNMADAAGTVNVNISAVAKVEKYGSTTYVGNLEDAFKTENDGATITLLDNVKITKSIDINAGGFTLDLNGYTVSSTAAQTYYVISGEITIKDSGTGGKIQCEGKGIEIRGGIVSVESGTVSGYCGVEISGGTVAISGDTVISGGDIGLHVTDAGKATLSGGTFSGTAAISANNYGSVTLKNLLAEGYAYHRNNLPITKAEGWVDSNTWGEVSLDTKARLTGTVTVKKCNHTGEGVCEYTHATSTTTHQQTCLACGKKWDEENCSYTDSRCACGSTLSVALAGTERLIYDGNPREPGVTVTLDGTKLAETDYGVTYANNINAGTDTATVTVKGKENYSFEIKKTFSIEKAEQKDFAATAVTTQYEKNGTFILSTTGGSGDGAVLYRVPENNGVLMVNGDQATIIGVGTVAVTATKAESDNYKAATATGKITIEKAPAPAITYPTAGSIAYGQKLSDSALTGGSTEYGTFAWENGSMVPAVDNTGYTVVFTASGETKKNYETIIDTTQKVSVKVEKAVPAVSITAAVSGSKDDRQSAITVNVAKAGAGAFPTGTVTFIDCTGSTEVEIGAATLSNGTASYTWDGLLDKTYTIKAVYAGDSNYKEAVSREFTFDAAKQNQQDFALDAIGAKTYGDAAVTLKTTGGNGSGAVRYESSDEDVIRIEDGRAVIVGAGTATITAIKEGDDKYNEASAGRNVTVAKKALTVRADSKTVVRGNPMPAFTYRADGLVNGDTFTTAPSITAGVQNTDTLGKYDIVINGGTLRNSESYHITYVNGTLKIVERFYTVTVTDGTGGGEYAEGDTVTVTANDRSGYTFTGWSSEDGVGFADSKAKTTTFTMPAKSVTVKANYTRNSSGGNNGGGSGDGGNSGGSGNNGGGNSADNGNNGGGGSTNPGNGNTTPQPFVTPSTETSTNPGNEIAPGTGTTPVNPGSGNTSRPGTTPGSGSAGMPSQGTKQPFIKGADGKIGWDVIRAEEENAEEGSVINVDMNGSTVVPGDIFDSIKGKDITITFDMGSGILWSVDGKNITTDKAGDIDFSVKTGVKTVPVDIINNVTGENYSIQISLAYEGEFGFTAVLSINFGKENAGYTASLYYYNESTGELEFICKDQIAEDGTVSLAFTHASDYVIMIGIEAMDGKEGVDDTSETPRAGDDSIIADVKENDEVAWIYKLVIAVGAIVVVAGFGIIFIWKKKKEEQ